MTVVRLIEEVEMVRFAVVIALVILVAIVLPAWVPAVHHVVCWGSSHAWMKSHYYPGCR